MKMFNTQPAMCNVKTMRHGFGSASPQSHFAFTLTELMVAVAVMTLLILAINQVFSTVSKAVRTGIGASEVIQNSRIIGQQLKQDFDAMLPPAQSGVLVIVNKNITGVHVLRADDLDENGSVSGSENSTNIRDDQIMFIRDVSGANKIEPLCPGGSTSFAGTSAAAAAKVWYGHGLRSNSDGGAPNPTVLGAAYTPGTGVAANHFAGEWVLARQALFLDSSVASGDSSAASALYNAAVSNVPHSPPVNQLWGATTDIAKSDLSNSSTTVLAMTGGTYNASYAGAASRLWESTAGQPITNSSNYADLATAYLYLPSQNRLLVNPSPDTSTNKFVPWQIAQMTPYLAGHVSDFVVEFAGDYASNPTAASPSGQPDGELDRYSDGSIVWYGLTVTPPTTGAAAGHFVTKSSAVINDYPIYDSSTGAYVFRHGSGAGTNWPYMIRVRYRLMDAKGQISGADGEPGRWFEQIMSVNR